MTTQSDTINSGIIVGGWFQPAQLHDNAFISELMICGVYPARHSEVSVHTPRMVPVEVQRDYRVRCQAPCCTPRHWPRRPDDAQAIEVTRDYEAAVIRHGAELSQQLGDAFEGVFEYAAKPDLLTGEGYPIEVFQKAFERTIYRMVACDTCNQHGTVICAPCEGHGDRVFTCAPCNVSGESGCMLCNGSGRLPCPNRCHLGSYPCSTCSGSGVTYPGWDKPVRCWSCFGAGRHQCFCGGSIACSCGNGRVCCPTCAGDGQLVYTCSVCEGAGRQRCAMCQGHGDHALGHELRAESVIDDAGTEHTCNANDWLLVKPALHESGSESVLTVESCELT